MTRLALWSAVRKLGFVSLRVRAAAEAGRCLECPKQRLLDNLDCAATPPYPLLDKSHPVLLYTDDTRYCAYFDCYPVYTYPTSRRPQTAPTRERLLAVAGHWD
jgi:hypothetical protein